jgi:hypothetical protein
MFDLNTNSFAVVLRCAPGSGIDRHYHTGAAAGFCLQVLGSKKSSTGSPGPERLSTSAPGKPIRCRLWVAADGREIGYLDAVRLLECCRRYREENGQDVPNLDRTTH